MDLGTAFLDDVLEADAVEPRRPLQEGVAEEPVVSAKQNISTSRKRVSVTEYVDVLLPNTFTYWISQAASLLTLSVGDNTAF